MTGWQIFIPLIVLAIVWHGCKLVLMTIRHRMNMAEIEAQTTAQAERAAVEAERAAAEAERMRLMFEAITGRKAS